MSEEIKALVKKRDTIEEELAQVNKDIIKVYVNNLLHHHAIDFKENGVPLPHFIRISFEDVYDDEGGYDTHFDNILFYDENQNILEIDFSVEVKRSWNQEMYDEEIAYVVREVIEENFDLDGLAACLGDDFKVQLR